MAYTTINKSTSFFNTVLFTGNQTARSITGVGFQPDLVWIKPRDNGSWSNNLTDVVRGAGYGLFSDLNNGQYNYGTGSNGSVTSFDSDGFSIGTATQVNNNSSNIVAWNWKANGAGSANTDGDINSTVSANTTAGFSIVKYTGNGVSGATVGHGLGVAPKIVLIKKTSSADNWSMLNTNINLNYYLKLNGNDAQVNDALFNNTAPSTTVFTVDSDGQVNGNTNEFIAYCFADVVGYSKFGAYTGNGNADGTFVYTGFKPSFLITKNISSTYHWNVNDAARDPFNVVSKRLYPSATSPEATSSNYYVDFLSNGFKIKTNHASINENGNTFIYMAFGQSLVGSNNVPCTAR